ncbi:MAG: glycosyltransferase [Candidatus Brocadiaceae bacterium]|nr:glycosyltransferase [Candidatus Brocadiaceae bacterium]
MSVPTDSQSRKLYSSSVPIVSVIMNCLNCETYLREAINSVFAQTSENWEIIFCEDNASVDNG